MEEGATGELRQSIRGWVGGQFPNRIGEATDSCRSTQGKKRSRGAEDRPPRAKNKNKKIKKTTMSTQVRGERDVGRGMGLQTGRAEAERIAMTKLRSIYNLLMVISFMSGAPTLVAGSPLRPASPCVCSRHNKALWIKALIVYK